MSLLCLILSNDPVGAIDTVRLNLEASSATWFSCVKDAGYAVAIGCAMEAPETFSIIKRWWSLRFRNEAREETVEEKASWIVPLAAVGLLMIVAGIVVETFAEGKVSDIDALLRAHESEKITEAENSAASAISDAGSASTSAQKAIDAENELEGKAANLRKQIDVAGKRLAWLGAREFTLKDRNDFKKYLSRFKGQKVVVTICGAQYLTLGDQELYFPAGGLASILFQIHWGTDGSATADFSCRSTMGMGVTVQERSDAPEDVKKAAKALQAAIDNALSQGFSISVAQPEGFLLQTPSSVKYLDADLLKVEVRMHPPDPTPLSEDDKQFLRTKP